MKKLVSIILLCTIISGIAAAEGNWYLETAMAAAVKLNDLVRDEVYLEMMASQSLASIENLKTSDFSTPAGAYRYSSFSSADLENMMHILSGGKLSDTASETLSSRFPQTLLSLHTGTLGTECVAASTMLTYSYTDQMPENFESCFVLLSYENAAASVSFSQTGTDTITIQAQPFFYSDMLTADEAIASFAPADLPVFPIISEKLL